MSKAAICDARLLSISRQVGAHLWHEGPAGGLQWDLNPQPLNTSVYRSADSTTEPSSTTYMGQEVQGCAMKGNILNLETVTEQGLGPKAGNFLGFSRIISPQNIPLSTCICTHICGQ